MFIGRLFVFFCLRKLLYLKKVIKVELDFFIRYPISKRDTSKRHADIIKVHRVKAMHMLNADFP